MATKNHAMGSSAKAAANITKPTIGIVIEFPAILAIDLLDFTESSTSGGAPHNFDWYLVVGITCVDSSSVAEANRWNSFFFSVQDIKWTVAQAPSLSLSLKLPTDLAAPSSEKIELQLVVRVIMEPSLNSPRARPFFAYWQRSGNRTFFCSSR